MNLSAIRSSWSRREWIKLITLGLQPLAYQLILHHPSRDTRNSLFWEAHWSQFTLFAFENMNTSSYAFKYFHVRLEVWNPAGSRSGDQIDQTMRHALNCWLPYLPRHWRSHASLCIMSNRTNALLVCWHVQKNPDVTVFIYMLKVNIVTSVVLQRTWKSPRRNHPSSCFYNKTLNIRPLCSQLPQGELF